MAEQDPQTSGLKIPPHSIEAEQAVLGGLMLDNQAWERMSDRVVVEDFYKKEHRLIFRAIFYLAESGQPLDVVTLHEFLEKEGESDSAGGLAYLGELAKNTPSAANIVAYADIVRERAVLREMITAANEIAESAYFPKGRHSNELMDEAERRVFAISEKREKTDSGPESVSIILNETLDKLEEIQKSKGGITGLSTGFKDSTLR